MSEGPAGTSLSKWTLRQVKIARETFAQVPRRPITVVRNGTPIEKLFA